MTLVFVRYRRYKIPWELPQWGVKYTWWEKVRCSTEIAVYLDKKLSYR